MAEYNKEKLYFLKLPKGFFRRHDMQILEALPNGKEYSLFYLKLILESLDHDGYLRFNESIPYDDGMLASVTNTKVEIVKKAIKSLKKMQLLEVLEDKTIYMRKVAEMTHQTTVSAEKKTIQRNQNEEKRSENTKSGQEVDKGWTEGGQGVDICPPEYRYKSIDLFVKDIKLKINNACVYARDMFAFEIDYIANALAYGCTAQDETYSGKVYTAEMWQKVVEEMDEQLISEVVNALHNNHPKNDGIRYTLGVFANKFEMHRGKQ